MQCSCGAATVDASARNKRHVLTYARCSACGRVGAETLRDRQDGQIIAQGIEARRQYQTQEAM